MNSFDILFLFSDIIKYGVQETQPHDPRVLRDSTGYRHLLPTPVLRQCRPRQILPTFDNATNNLSRQNLAMSNSFICFYQFMLTCISFTTFSYPVINSQ